MRKERNEFEGDAERTGIICYECITFEKRMQAKGRRTDFFSESSKTDMNCILELDEKVALNKENF